MLINRVKPSWYMAGFCLAWSIVSLLTFLAKDYASMVVLRFFLGVTEAPVSIPMPEFRATTKDV
jgi:MFS family permease